jgi:hypothetical protein
MIIPLNLPDHVAIYMAKVMCPILKGTSKEASEFAEEFITKFELTAKWPDELPDITENCDG